VHATSPASVAGARGCWRIDCESAFHVSRHVAK
jgi:hypothetical protein